MKKPYIGFFMLFSLATTSANAAEGGGPAFWLIMPLASQIATCAVHGPEMRKNISDALIIGKGHSQGKIPENVWGFFTSLLSTGTEDRQPNSDIKKACNGLADMYRDQRFSTHFRQLVVSQLVTFPAIDCIIEQPDQARQIKDAWLGAFLRNGLELSENMIDETVTAMNSQKSGAVPNPSDCKQLTTMFSSQDFDAQYGEKGVYDLFAKH